MSLVVFGMVLPWLLVGLLAWLAYLFLQQMGRILLRLDAMENQLNQLRAAPVGAPAPPAGLQVGAVAPAFELPDLAGVRQSLTGFRGRPLLLIFFNPRCSFCTKMMPELAALDGAGAGGRPAPVVLTTGDPEENRRLFQEHSIRCPVLLQREMEVANQYQAHGTPMGYLIDAEGKIATPRTVGADALLALSSLPDEPATDNEAGTGGQNGHLQPLAEPAASPGDRAPAALANGSSSSRGKVNKGLAESRINRNGLKAGAKAPAFRLPRLEGDEVSLADYQGRRLLLVFSDPHCGPCDQLAPLLEQRHRENRDPLIVMVSRQDADTNRAKVAKLGLTFPVVLQKQWEISLRYGMFATPIAYLIDEHGIIAADVAVGVEPILALASAHSESKSHEALI